MNEANSVQTRSSCTIAEAEFWPLTANLTCRRAAPLEAGQIVTFEIGMVLDDLLDAYA